MNEKDILKKLKGICSEAKSFLSNKGKTIKEKEMLIVDLQNTISDAKAKGVETSAMNTALKQFEGDLHSEEMRDVDILQENLYIIEASQLLNTLFNDDSDTFYNESKRISGLRTKKADIEGLNSQYEGRIKEIKGETEEKNKLRLDILENSDFISSIDKDFLSFEGRYGEREKGVLGFDSQIAKEQTKRDELQKEIDELDFEIGSGYSAFKGVHKDLVDNRMNFNSVEARRQEVEGVNTTYGVSGIELKNIQSESDSMKANLDEISTKEKEIDAKIVELKESKDKLVSQVQKRDATISQLKGEKNVLEGTNEAKDIDIKSLKGKLTAWDSNYKEFEKLVDNLEDHVGYPQFSNIEGDDTPEGQNPLVGLIDRIEKITAWIEEQENLGTTQVVQQEQSFTPYLIGAVAVGALMMFKR